MRHVRHLRDLYRQRNIYHSLKHIPRDRRYALQFLAHPCMHSSVHSGLPACSYIDVHVRVALRGHVRMYYTFEDSRTRDASVSSERSLSGNEVSGEHHHTSAWRGWEMALNVQVYTHTHL